MKAYKIQGWNYRFNASGFLPETYNTLEEAEKGVEKNKWIMDDWIINEIEVEENK